MSANTPGISMRSTSERNRCPDIDAILATSNSTLGQQSERENSYATSGKNSQENQLHGMLEPTCMIAKSEKAAPFL
jgi:hypothetical protein